MKLSRRTAGSLLGLAALVIAGLAGMHVTHLLENGSGRHVGEAGLLAAWAFGTWRLSRHLERTGFAQEVGE